jgi:integrase/recombinase XerD
MGKLQDRMRRDMELKNFSPRTIHTYLCWMKRFVLYNGRTPEELGDEDIRRYLHSIAVEGRASQSGINQAYSALRFFYEVSLGRGWDTVRIPRAKVEKRLPVVLSMEEVRKAIGLVRNLKYRTILMTIYSGGLRLGEALGLMVGDIDSKRMMIRVKQGKGHKDRYTILGERMLEMLRVYWDVHRPKNWLFPSNRGDFPVSRSSVQKVFKKALIRAGIRKEASVHTLRHSFATHLLEGGVDLQYIQRLMGHTTVKTTSIYLHVTRKDLQGIKSPIDLMGNIEKPVM